MPIAPNDLPAGVLDWVAALGPGEISQLRRHVARREAWVVDVTRSDGSVLQGFLRLQREVDTVDPRRLERETRIVQALAGTEVPVPKVYGGTPELQATVFERDPGRADLDKLDDPARQRAVMEDFIRAIAKLHTLDVESLGLADVMHYMPKTPKECALGEVELIVSQWSRFIEKQDDPLTVYALDWLRRLAPDSVARTSLVQGDTGPVNFMYQDDRVSAIIDWELGHFGDPLEDLGNIAVREFWNPSGGLSGLFELYEAESGIPYDRFRARYYAVHQNVRGMMPIHYVCENAHPRESLAWYLAYRYIGDRATCEMLAAAMGVDLEPPELPKHEGERDILAESAVYALSHDIAPAVTDPFASSRVSDTETLIQCMDRKRRYGSWTAKLELEELSKLLGIAPVSLADSRRAFRAAVSDGHLDDESIIRTLSAKAYRDEWLHQPAVALYPERRWSRLD